MLKRLIALTIVLLAATFAQAPGTYTGTWASGSSGNSGKLTIVFTADNLSSASFTLQNQEVKAKPITSKNSAEGVEFVFEYEVDGNLLRSKMQGTVAGKTIKGKYQSLTADGGAPVDEGTWEVTQQ